MSHLPFVCKDVALEQYRTYVILVYAGIVRVGLFNALLTQLYVKSLQLAYKLLVLCKEEGQLGLLECQCQVGFNDVGSDIVGVVLCHKS